MAEGYVSLPWLKPADPTREFNDAYAQGAQVSEANARLTEEQNRVAIEAQVRADTLARDTAMQNQKIANEKAYHDQEISIRKQGLDNAAATIAQRGQVAAKKLEAQQRFNDLVAKGVPPEQAMFQSGLGTPQIAAEYDKSRATGAAANVRAEIDRQRLAQQNARGNLLSTTSTNDTTNNVKTTTYNRQPLIPPPLNPPDASGQGTSPFKEGKTIRNKKDGKIYVVKNGIPIPSAEGETQATEP